MLKELKRLMGDVLRRSLFVRNKGENLIESANAKVRANIPNTGNIISIANLRGLSSCKNDNNERGV